MPFSLDLRWGEVSHCVGMLIQGNFQQGNHLPELSPPNLQKPTLTHIREAFQKVCHVLDAAYMQTLCFPRTFAVN